MYAANSLARKLEQEKDQITPVAATCPAGEDPTGNLKDKRQKPAFFLVGKGLQFPTGYLVDYLSGRGVRELHPMAARGTLTQPSL